MSTQNNTFLVVKSWFCWLLHVVFVGFRLWLCGFGGRKFSFFIDLAADSIFVFLILLTLGNRGVIIVYRVTEIKEAPRCIFRICIHIL